MRRFSLLTALGALSFSLTAVTSLTLLTDCADGDTGGTLVNFHAYARGLPTENGALTFDTSSGYRVVLTHATLHIGAVYLSLVEPNAGSAIPSCVSASIYGLQVPGPVDVDVLNPNLQEFSVLGNASSEVDLSGEIWLTGGGIDDFESPPAVIVSATGTATGAAGAFPFTVNMTIDENRATAASTTEPGANPICRKRIVAGISINIQPSTGGDLALTIDPRFWFDNIDFAELDPATDGSGTFVIPDESDGTDVGATQGRLFYLGVTQASASEYDFQWFNP